MGGYFLRSWWTNDFVYSGRNGQSTIKRLLGSQSFSLEDSKFTKIRQLEELLSSALEFEKDMVMFYNLLRSFIADKATLDYLDSIIREENEQIRQLQVFLDSGAIEDAIISEGLHSGNGI